MSLELELLVEMKEQQGRIEAYVQDIKENQQAQWSKLTEHDKEIKDLTKITAKAAGAVQLLYLISLLAGIAVAFIKLHNS